MSSDPDKLTDQQLDELLRNVTVPSDLKAQLLQIPEAEKKADLPLTETGTVKDGRKRLNGRWLLALAASLLLIAGFYAWILANPTGQENRIASPENKTAPTSNRGNELQTGGALIQIDEQIHSVNEKLLELTIQNKRRELGLVESKLDYELESAEINSIILAAAEEIVIPLGGDKESVKTRVADVINSYPGTLGAKLADQYLEQINN